VSVVHADDAVVHELDGSRFVSYASPSRGSAELCAWRLELRAGSVGVSHTITREEIFCVLDGVLRVTLDGEISQARPGDVVVVAAGTTLSVDNPGDATATVWVTTSVGIEAEFGDGSRIVPPWTR